MIVTQQWSPQHQDSIWEETPREPPALSRWSDVTFLTYSNFWSQRGICTPPCPRYLIIDNVQNDQALAALAKYQERHQSLKHPPQFPGIAFKDTDPDEWFKVLVGVPQSRGVALFLFQHKDVFGPKKISTIRWTARQKTVIRMATQWEGNWSHTLVFEVVDA